MNHAHFVWPRFSKKRESSIFFTDRTQKAPGIVVDRQSVQSSSIASVGYDETTETLEIEFQNGAIYRYFDVPEHVFHRLMRAPSKGQFVNFRIKNSYFCARVE